MAEPITMTVNAAALAAGVDRKTLQRRLNETNAEPDAAGEFTLKQIVRALTGGLASAKARRAIAEADLAELKRDRLLEKLMEVDVAADLLSEVATTLRDRIMALDSLSKPDKHKLLAVLRAPPTEAELVAAQRGADAGDFRPIEETEE